MRRRLALAALLLPLAALAPAAQAQTEGVLQIEGDLERFVLRQHALGHLPGLDVGSLPFNRREVLARLDTLRADLTRTDQQLLDGYLGREAAGLFGERASGATLYPNNVSFLRIAEEDYAVEFSPLLGLAAGPALVNRPGGGGEETVSAWEAARGARAAGHVGRFFAEARVTETQVLVPNGSRTRSTAPRVAFARTSGQPDPEYDYLRATGLVGYRDKRVEVRAGRDRNRWGFARGSLALSNYASEYDHAQVRLTLGPISFQSLYARFLDPREPGGSDRDGVVEQRYGAFHRASARVGAGVELEVFETVMFGDREDDNRNGFEPAYLVPFGFYRAVERDLGSPDNMLLGAGASWQAASGVRVYAQGLLDELVASEFFDEAFTSKWGFVVGAQVADLGLPNTDLQIEYARIRPYVYAHRDSVSAAVHYGDVLGHPAGPNASDLSLRVEHRPGRDWVVSADLAYTVRGRDTEAVNFGSDPQRDTDDDRPPEPLPTLQGVRQRLAYADVQVGARLLPDATAGVRLLAAYTDDEEDGRSGFVAPQVFLRWAFVPLGPRY